MAPGNFWDESAPVGVSSHRLRCKRSPVASDSGLRPSSFASPKRSRPRTRLRTPAFPSPAIPLEPARLRPVTVREAPITTTRIQRSHYLLLRAGALLGDALGGSLLMIIPGSIGSLVALLLGSEPRVLSAIWWSTAGVLVLILLIRDSWRGRSPGKRLLGLSLHTSSGRPCGVLRSIVRNVPLLVPGVILIEILLVVATSKSRRLGDLIARTAVTEE